MQADKNTPQDALPAFDAKLAQIIQGRYELVTCLKYTDVRQVYLARDLADEERVILKVAQEQAGQRLADEYALLQLLQGDFFPQGKSLLHKNGYTILVRQYVLGVTLRDYAETREVAPAEAVSITVKALCIAAQLHAQPTPLVHRDLSPGNFILKPNGGICLIDLDSVHAHDKKKKTDTVCLGTPGTAAPEQYGARRSDARADIFGLGKLAVYLLTGGYDIEMLERQNLPKKLVRTLDRATQFDPDRRYGSLTHLERALRACVPRQHPRRWPWVILAAALSLAVGMAAGTWLMEARLRGVREPDVQASDAQPATVRLLDVPPKPSAIVQFASAPIAKAVEVQLRIPLSEISYAHLAHVESLVIVGATYPERFEDVVSYGKSNTLIQGRFVEDQTKSSALSLEDLEYMPNLKKLCICNAFVSDLEPISSLSLTHLTLADNPLSDLTPLQNMQTLEYLDICGTEVRDLSPLAGLTNLTHLRTVQIPATDLSPVCELPIETLFTTANNFEDDVTALGRLTALRVLSIDDTPPEALPIINSMPWLTSLNPLAYPATTLRDISGLYNLKWLYFYSNELQSLEGIEELSQLQELTLMGMECLDAAPLTQLPNLNYLDISRSKLTNLSVLSQIPTLRQLVVQESDLAALPELPPEVEVRIP